ncbi:integral membrane protein PTH11 [Fusarium heterosporum]|uniref:Integral membrane protein PTH11 n=1 Tax=Fusarium heterosporum TaxID=42747 RepID=A0A8H5THG7_FUSHE|nr:integral membrane protein PTH11 [Fusarium heterosporum]
MVTIDNKFAIEAFTLLSIGILVILLRTYARIRQAGIRNFEADDYLMLLAIIPYTIETVLAYTVGSQFHGLTNSGMTDKEREALSPDSDEYGWRVNGSKIQIAGWVMYATVLWTIKCALCAFYYRLTAGLNGYKIRVYIGFVLIASTYVAVVCSILLTCQPFNHFWQISPDPGNFCHPALSKIYIFVIVCLNVVTDAYLLAIPIHMLWGARIPTIKKYCLLVIFSGAIFVMIAGLLRCFLILLNPETGPEEGAAWAVRESFVAVVTANLPCIWAWMRQKLKPLLGSLLSSNKSSKNKDDVQLGHNKTSSGVLDCKSRNSRLTQIPTAAGMSIDWSDQSGRSVYIHGTETSSFDSMLPTFHVVTNDALQASLTPPTFYSRS